MTIHYDPYAKTLAEVKGYFSAENERFPGLLPLLDDFVAKPSLITAKAFMGAYFKLHTKDDIESLRMATAVFTDKRHVKAIVESILEDEDALKGIAQRSYPHPIGFDKLVLFDDKETGFKFRLHIYWRGNQRAAMERMHLHRFEMASAIVSGELTNHIHRVAEYRPVQNSLLPRMQLPAANDDVNARTTHYAYSGYWRDPANNTLHKALVGECDMTRGESETFLSGHCYAQLLEDAHYVETNAETGKSNGDVCSTIYVHSGGLKDDGGRGMPILFEEFRLAHDDQVIETIPEMQAEALRKSLEHYRDFLQNNLDFYEWIYDPRHGRDLSTGMIAGYLLAESWQNPHTLKLWMDHEPECKETLDECSQTLTQLIRGEKKLSDLSDDDRKKRYYALLLDKAEKHPGGKDAWHVQNGNLVKEMWRYCAAIKGEKPDVTVLKPMWENVTGRRLPGGAHYGRIAAMIEAVFDANAVARARYQSGLETTFKVDGSPVCAADREIQNLIEKKLSEYYPGYHFTGEESDVAYTTPAEGDRRWLVDPIDGTRNFLHGREEFCVSIACQRFTNGAWDTTDGVVASPLSGRIFWAEKGKGAYVIERNDLEKILHVPDAASRQGLKNSLIDISISGYGPDAEGQIIHDLRAEDAKYRANGSAAMMLSLVSGMGSDGVIITAHDYDIAAAKLIALEASAEISEFSFKREGITHYATVAAVNKKLHADLENIARNAAMVISPDNAPTLGLQ